MAGFAQVWAKARQDVHKTLAVRCLYTPPYADPSVLPTELTARLHTKIVTGGAQSPGYAQVIEGVNRAIFQTSELTAKNVVLKKNGLVEFPDFHLAFKLDVLSASFGVAEQKWMLGSPT